MGNAGIGRVHSVRPDAPVLWFDEIDSTNEEARRRAQVDDFGPVWIAGRKQTAGRGRLGRQWDSPTGNLFVTALFEEEGGLVKATRYPFAAGLAILDAASEFIDSGQLQVKWPNDVRASRQKISGILVEAGAASGKACWVACGMGVNVRFAPDGAGQAATSLLDLGAPQIITAEMFLDALRPAFVKRCAQASSDFASLLTDWQKYAEGLGEEVTVGKGADAQIGIFKGVGPDGALLLASGDGTTHTIRAGDVELVKEIGGHAARD